MISEVEGRVFQDRWKRRRQICRRGHWDPSMKNGGIYEDVDASVQTYVEAENGVDSSQRPSLEESFRGTDVKRNITVGGCRHDMRREGGHYENGLESTDASFRRLRTNSAKRPEQIVHDRYLTDTMRPRQKKTISDLDRDVSCLEKRSGDLKGRRRNENMRYTSRYSSSSISVDFEESPPSKNVNLNKAITSKKRENNLKSENSLHCARNTTKPRRVLQPCLSDRYRPNFDTIYDRAGQRTGKENIPPGIGEHCDQKIEKPIVTTKRQSKALSRLASIQKSIQKQFPEVDKHMSLNENRAGNPIRKSKKAKTTPKEQSNLEEEMRNDENDSKSTAYSHSKIYNWTSSAIKIDHMASQSLQSVSCHLSYGSEINLSDNTSMTRATVSYVHPNVQQRQKKTLQWTSSHAIIKASMSLNTRILFYNSLVSETIGSYYPTRLTQHLIHSHIHQDCAQNQRYHPEDQADEEVQRILLPYSYSDRSQCFLYQPLNLKACIESVKHLSYQREIHGYQAVIKITNQLDLVQLLRALCFSTQACFPQNIRHFQSTYTKTINNGNTAFPSSCLPIRNTRRFTAAQITSTAPNHSYHRRAGQTRFPVPLKEQDISYLLVSMHDRRSRLLLFFATCVYVYTLYYRTMQTLFRLKFLALTVDLDIVMRN